MANKNVTIKKRNAGNTGWDEMYPVTTAENVKCGDGSSVEAQLGDIAYKTVGGTANDITVSKTGFTLTDGQYVEFKANATNTGNMTLSVNGLSPKSLRNEDGEQLIGGNIEQDKYYKVIYDQTNDFFLQRPNGLSKTKEREYQRKVSNLSAVADIYDNRSVGSTGVWYDLLDGTNDYSKGKMDTTSTRATQALTIGETILTDKVESTEGFKLGQEITIQDDVNKETVHVTKPDTIESTVFDYTTPNELINQPYWTNSNQPPIMLDNGWLVMMVYESGVGYKIYRVKEDGTKELLLYSSSSYIVGGSIVSKGNIIYVMVSSSSNVYLFSWDVTLISPNSTFASAPRIQYSILDTGQTAIDYGRISINDAGTEICAVWASVNSSYPNSMNIRANLGYIVPDGTVSWQGTEQVTEYNLSGTSFVRPVVTFSKENVPIIVCRYQSNNTNYLIAKSRFVLGSWEFQSGVYNSGTGNKVQDFPQIITQKYGPKEGRIWIVWQGSDQNEDPDRTNIRIMYTDNGGDTWSKAGIGDDEKLTTGNLYNQYTPVLTENKDGDIYVVWRGFGEGHATQQIKMIKRSGDTWGNIEYITSDSETNITPTVCTNVYDFEKPLMLWTVNSKKILFYGKYTRTAVTSYLEVTALTKAFKKNTGIYRSNVILDTVTKTMRIGEFIEDETRDNTTPVNIVNLTPGFDRRARPLVLVNGWVVVSIHNSTSKKIEFYVDKNDGNGFVFLVNKSYGEVALNSWATVSYGTHIVLVLGRLSNSISYDYFDVTNLLSTGNGWLDAQNLTVIDDCSLAISDDKTKIFATWTCKNSSYPNSLNIRAVNGTIESNGSIMWGIVEQVTKNDVSGRDNRTPSASYTLNGFPVISYKSTLETGFKQILLLRWTGTEWVNSEIFGQTSLDQFNPEIITQKYGQNSGRLWCTWQGADLENSNAYNIFIKYSDNNGAGWINGGVTLYRVSNYSYTQSGPSITEDINGNIYVLWYGIDSQSGGVYRIKMAKRTDTWGEIESLTLNSGNHILSPISCNNFYDFEEPIVMWKDLANTKSVLYGKWVIENRTPFLISDVRYSVSPESPTSEIVAWVEHEKDAGYTVDAQLSIVTDSATESYTSMTKSTTDIDTIQEEEFVGVTGTKGNNATVKLTLTRTNTSIDKSVTKVLGAIGE